MLTVADEVMTQFVLLMILLKPQDTAAAVDTTDTHLPSRDLHVDIAVSPPAPQLLFLGTQMRIRVIVTSANDSSYDGRLPVCNASTVMMSVSSNRPKTVRVRTASDRANDTLTGLHFPLNHSVVLIVYAVSVGRAVLTFEISNASNSLDTTNKIAMNMDKGVNVHYTAVRDDVESLKNPASTYSTNADGGRQLISRSNRSRLLVVIEYQITVARRRRSIDDAFFWAVAAATLLNAFGLGCVTIYNDIKKELRKLQPSVLATLLCQFIILPSVY